MSKTGKSKKAFHPNGRRVQKLRDERIGRQTSGLNFNQWMTYTRTDAKKHAVLAAGALTLFAGTAYGMPDGFSIVNGNITITRPDGTTMHITQVGDKAIINWNGYSIAANELVRYFQPGTNSISLNRVIGADISTIYGQLQANGQVWLINPNGVIIGPGAQVNTAGFLASTLGITNENFMDGKYVFSGPSSSIAKIINQGTITSTDGGYVALLAPKVRNEGTILANLGQVALASGSEITLNFSGNSLINLVIDKATDNALVENAGKIMADGGQVLLSAKTASDVLKNVVNNTGIIEARSLVNREGKIVLDGGDAGITANSGTLNVSSAEAGAKGGSVSVLGKNVALYDGTNIDASGDAGGGTVLIGGNYQGKGPERNASQTYVAKNAVIKADATGKGDGGKVIVWSDNATKFYGSISAKGGAQGGNGGFVETSGKKTLTVGGTVDAGAPAGIGGSWLLDPNNITITNAVGNTNIDPANPFNSTGDDAVVSASVLGAALTNGTNVKVQTTSAGGDTQNGDITVDAAVTASLAAGQSATLNLNAQGDIAFTASGSINNGAGALNVNLNSGMDSSLTTPGTNASSITMASGSSITTGGGNVTATAGKDITIGGTVNAGSGTVALNFGKQGSGGTLDLSSSSVTASSVTIAGGGGIDTIKGPNTANTWSISGANAGALNTIMGFSSIERLIGGNSTDSFTVASGIIFNGTINGGTGTDTLAATNGTNTWNISGANAGTLNGTDFSNIENLQGGSGADTFTLGSGVATFGGSIDGGAGTDTLAATDGTNAWNISAAKTGSLNGTTNFSLMENLTGGSGADTFTLAAGLGTFGGTIDGGAGSDTLAATNGDNTWNITSANGGKL
ncbi:MAG TPA: filamentous hemagglutinin N-terminal domain-containing protein, partial [Chloroflexota bacterium]|nr:filamentous hemagglutinin N-terminal domain-containing protein [Chloroflexota bacterium]